MRNKNIILCVFRIYQREVSISSYTVLLIFDPCVRWQLCVKHKQCCSSVELYTAGHSLRRHTMKVHRVLKHQIRRQLRHRTHHRWKHKIHRWLKHKKSWSSRELCTAWHTVRKHTIYYFVTGTMGRLKSLAIRHRLVCLCSHKSCGTCVRCIAFLVLDPCRLRVKWAAYS